MFQNYWFVFNLLLLAASCCKAKLDPSSSEIVTRNPLVYNICLVICISSGFTSFFLFHCQQKILQIFDNKKIAHIGPIQWMGWSMIKENTEMSIQRKKTRQMKKLKESRAKKIFLSLGDLLLTLLEYGWVVRESLVRGGICPCRQCRRQCKIFVSGVNFSIFTNLFLCFITKTFEIW